MNNDFRNAVIDGDVESVSWVLGGGADVDARDKHAQTALMLAANRGHTDLVALLIARGADLDVTAKHNLSALMLAIVGEHPDTALSLINAGADLSIRGSGAPGFHEKTALDLAEHHGLEEVAEAIRKRSAEDGA